LFLFGKKGREQLFESWVRLHRDALYRHAMWMTGHNDVAVDMVQETYFQAWQALDTLQDSEKALPWLITILRRSIYREQRKQYRHKETMQKLRELDLNSTVADSGDILEIYKLLDGVSLAHREIFLLHYLHGFSYEEISEQLNIPKGTVMSRLSRAKNKLQALQISDASNVILINKHSSGN